MLIRTLDDVRGTDRYRILFGGDTHSARFLTAADGMGFSLHFNRAVASPPHRLWYKHHWEANYILSGRVEVTDLTSGEAWSVGAGDLYQVGPNDRHHFHVLEDEQHVSVFCPALHGDEGHDSDGAYSPSGPVPVTDRRMFVRRVSELRAAGRETIDVNGQVATIHALTGADALGFSLCDVTVAAGATTGLCAGRHQVANYIVSGAGKVDDLASGESWTLEPGMLYTVGPQDRHRLSAQSRLHLLSVCCPPRSAEEPHTASVTLERCTRPGDD